jgi:adenylate kinase
MGVPQISTGDMLRHHIELADELGRRVQSTMAAGRLVSDELVNELVAVRLSQKDAAPGFILDGYPRTVQQAEVMGKMLEERKIAPVVIHLKVDYNKIINRLSGRRVCPVCGTLYSLGSNAPKIEGICDKDGARLVTREDDSEPVVRRRLEEYDVQTKPLVEYFQQHRVPYHEVDGNEGAPQAIARRICGLMKRG